MRVYETIASNTCPNINAELLLMSILEYTMRAALFSLVLFVKIYDVSTKTCLVWKEH
jgi:hypothetical protein